MKTFSTVCIFLLLLFSCNSSQYISENATQNDAPEEDVVRIANDDLEYEIIIIEPGFNTWLASTARPEGYYSQPYMETRNSIYVQAYNSRVLQPSRFDANLYEMQIDYRPGVDYGYDVNYKLYNYFIYFQLTYNQKLAGFIPRI